MQLIIIILRTFFFYFFILVILRVMGKKVVGQLSINDFIISILISDLVVLGIEKYDTPSIYVIIPILILLFLELASSYISLKSNKIRNFLEGKPVLIINRGIINYKEMIKQKYTLDNLLYELRKRSIKDINEVEYAVLENDGSLNIFKYNFIDLNQTYPLPLILDGVIQDDTLDYIGKSRTWINNYLKENHVNKNNIFYAFYKNKNIYIITKKDIM